MRDWERRTAELEEAGGRLVFVTGEDEDAVRTALKDKGLGGTWVIVGPEVWAEWQVANDRRGELPVPGTVVIDRTGEVKRMDLFTNHTMRRSPRKTVAFVLGDGAAPPPPDTSLAAAPDFGTAVSIHLEPTDAGGSLRLEVAPGFVVYGRKERQAVPLSIEFDTESTRARLPRGAKKRTSTGAQWVLTDVSEIEIRAPGDPPSIEGRLQYQVCYESLCAPPSVGDWVIVR